MMSHPVDDKIIEGESARTISLVWHAMFQRFLSQYVMPLFFVALGAGGLLWLSAKDAPPERVVKQPTPPLVETVALQADVSNFQIQIGGNVVPRREVTLSSEVAGAIVSKGETIESGRHVEKDTPLLQIDPARFELQVSELDSELHQVAADLRQLATEESGTNELILLAKRESEITIAASKRLKALSLKNAVTEAELEAAEKAELQVRNTLRVLTNQSELIPIRRERLLAQRKLTELKKEQAQLNLDRTKIVAPFSGVITSVMVEKGNYVKTGDVLLKMEDTSAIDVECSLRMDDLYWLWNSSMSKLGYSSDDSKPDSTVHSEVSDFGKTLDESAMASRQNLRDVFEIPPAEATVTGEIAGRLFHWKGRLERYEGRGVDRKTRTVLCRVRVPKPTRVDVKDGPPTLLRGMYVTVTLDVTPQTQLWRIPTRAVQPNGQIWTVENGLLRVHNVKPAKVLPDSVLIRADATDLKPGDHVVITQLTTPLDGSKAREVIKEKTGELRTASDGSYQP